MLLLESIMSLQFRPSTSISNCGHFWGSEERRAANFMVPWSKVNRRRETDDNCFARMKNELTRTIRVRRKCSGSGSGSGSGLIGENGKNSYHPFEDILNTEDTGIEERRLTAAETSRTIVEVNSKATLMFSGMAEGRVLHNLFWPDLPYLTDEHGNVYFQVNIDEDIMQALTSADNYVHVILGVDTREALGPGEVIDFGIKEIEEEDTDSDEEDEDSDDDEEDEDSDDDEDIVDFDFDEEWVDILEDEEDEDQVDSDGSLGDWAELETMHSSHPMSFATKIAEAQHASNNPIDYMKQPQDGLAIQGLIRPAFIEEQSIIQKHRSNHETDGTRDTYISKDDNNIDDKDIGQVNGHAIELFSSEDNGWAEDIEKDYNTGVGKTFYKLEMIKIELILASGHQAVVDVDEYRKACPDAIAHSASKIISHVNAGGEKTTHALKTLCWKCKGIHVEEASLIGVDTLGFDLRVCSGTQIQTLRFAFNSRATSEYSAERQLNDLLFPRSNQKPQKVKQAQQKDG